MKNFVLVIVLLSCFLIGFYIKKYYELRKTTYKKLCFFIEKLINCISYNNEKLDVFVHNERIETQGNFEKFLKIYEDYLFHKIDEITFEKEIKKVFNFLKVYELIELSRFLISIGGKTREEEIKGLNNYLFNLKEKRTLEIENYNKFGKLYFKLFIILGLALFIIFL